MYKPHRMLVCTGNDFRKILNFVPEEAENRQILNLLKSIDHTIHPQRFVSIIFLTYIIFKTRYLRVHAELNVYQIFFRLHFKQKQSNLIVCSRKKVFA